MFVSFPAAEVSGPVTLGGPPSNAFVIGSYCIMIIIVYYNRNATNGYRICRQKDNRIENHGRQRSGRPTARPETADDPCGAPPRTDACTTAQRGDPRHPPHRPHSSDPAATGAADHGG